MSRAEPLSILAVEDEALIAMELEDMLEALGHEVIGPAATAADALALLTRTRPDAAIVDVNLAGETSAPVIGALRDKAIPFILATGYEASELSWVTPCAPLLRKPYTARDMARILKTLAAAGT